MESQSAVKSGSSSRKKCKKHKKDDKLSHKESKRSSRPEKKEDDVMVKTIKHYEVFYNQLPPGLVQEEQEKPEDCIPDLPENVEAREFLAKAPKKGLWMPLGREVKVMKCWRCKTYGHRTGDKECPLFISGNTTNEQFRYIHEDPMHDFVQDKKKAQKKESLDRVRQLQLLLEESTSSDSSSSSSSSSSGTTSSSTSSSDNKKRKRSKDKHSRSASAKRHQKRKKNKIDKRKRKN